jgi:hypothetical protein
LLQKPKGKRGRGEVLWKAKEQDDMSKVTKSPITTIEDIASQRKAYWKRATL